MSTAPTPSSEPSIGRRAIFSAAVVAAVGLGLWFRLTNLDRKYFWFDEAHSAAIVSGRPVEKIEADFDGRPHRWADLKEYFRPETGASSIGVCEALVHSHPENAPLYFLALREWTAVAGGSVAKLRLFSAVLSILCLPLCWLLSKELFGSNYVAWTATAWMSLSPFFVLYAQEARTYAMLTLTALAATLFLARAVRRRSIVDWALYGISTGAGLNIHMFFGLLMAAHALFLAVYLGGEITTRQGRRLAGAFAASAALGVLSFLPWFVVFLRNADHRALEEFLDKGLSPLELAETLLQNVGVVLVDFGFRASPWARVVAWTTTLAAAAVIVYRFYYLLRHGPRLGARLLLVMAVAVPLLFMAGDLATSSSRSQVVRYWWPALLAMGIAVSYALGSQIRAGSRPAFAAAILLAASAAYCNFRSAEETTWWNKGAIVGSLEFFLVEDAVMREMFDVINREDRPIVVMEYDSHKTFQLLAMSTLVDDDTEWLGVRDVKNIAIPSGRPIYVYRSAQLVEEWQEAGRRLTPLEYSGKFHRLEPEAGEPAGSPERTD